MELERSASVLVIGVPPMQASTRAAGLRVDLTIVVSPVRSLTSIDQSFWPRNRQIKHHPGSAVSVRLHNRGGSTFLHLSVGVGDTLSVFHTSGRRAKTLLHATHGCIPCCPNP